MNPLLQVVILFLPLIIAGFIHMAVVKFDLFPGLKVPVHQQWFGSNKTWRGIVVMPLATAIATYPVSAIWPMVFAGANWFLLGLVQGTAYVLSELPNSYFKRRVGVQPGKRPPRYAFLFALADQGDFVLGCAFVYWLMLSLSLGMVLLVIVMGPIIHLVVNFTLYLLRLRKEPI